MQNMQLLTAVKRYIRVSNNSKDEEIYELIEAAKADMSVAGIDRIDEADPLIIQAIKDYCRANFGYGDNVDKAYYQERYDKQKSTLSTSSKYHNYGGAHE